jgi:hypothetical protein
VAIQGGGRQTEENQCVRNTYLALVGMPREGPLGEISLIWEAESRNTSSTVSGEKTPANSSASRRSALVNSMRPPLRSEGRIVLEGEGQVNTERLSSGRT